MDVLIAILTTPPRSEPIKAHGRSLDGLERDWIDDPSNDERAEQSGAAEAGIGLICNRCDVKNTTASAAVESRILCRTDEAPVSDDADYPLVLQSRGHAAASAAARPHAKAAASRGRGGPELHIAFDSSVKTPCRVDAEHFRDPTRRRPSDLAAEPDSACTWWSRISSCPCTIQYIPSPISSCRMTICEHSWVKAPEHCIVCRQKRAFLAVRAEPTQSDSPPVSHATKLVRAKGTQSLKRVRGVI